MNLTLDTSKEIKSLWKSITKLGDYMNVDPWYLDSAVASITKDNETRRKQCWLKWVAEGSKKTGKLFRWIKIVDIISPANNSIMAKLILTWTWMLA